MEVEGATITTSTVELVTLVKPSGELDLASCDGLERAIAAGDCEPGCVVYVDLSDATFIDASIVGVLVRSGRRLAAQGSKLKIFGASGLVAQVLTLTGIADSYRADVEAPGVAAERGRLG
jgi:anti-anti-sigma factor